MKSILLHIHDDHAQDARLAIALDLARAFQAHITCVQVSPFDSYIISDPLGGLFASTQLLDALEEREEHERTRLEQRLESEGVSWDWKHADGDTAQALISHGRLADILVVSRQDKDRDGQPGPLPVAADVVIHTRAPVLVVPPGGHRFRADSPVVIAWNGSPEAAHSLRLVLPLLRLAKEVHIVTVSDDDVDFPQTEARQYLGYHGIGSELHAWPRKGRRTAETLAEAARELQGAYIVMGAYGHSRLRETVVGGVTRDLLADATIPLLLAH